MQNTSDIELHQNVFKQNFFPTRPDRFFCFILFAPKTIKTKNYFSISNQRNYNPTSDYVTTSKYLIFVD